jgi:hypothetical protein
MYNVSAIGYAKMKVVCYVKCGEPFLAEIEIQPIVTKDIYGEGRVSHLLGKMNRLEMVIDADSAPRSLSKSQLELYDWVQEHPLSDDEDDCSSCCCGRSEGEDDDLETSSSLSCSTSDDNDDEGGDCSIDNDSSSSPRRRIGQIDEAAGREEDTTARYSFLSPVAARGPPFTISCGRSCAVGSGSSQSPPLMLLGKNKRSHMIAATCTTYCAGTSGRDRNREREEDDEDATSMDVSEEEMLYGRYTNNKKYFKMGEGDCRDEWQKQEQHGGDLHANHTKIKHIAPAALLRRRVTFPGFLSSPGADLAMRKRSRSAV